eukprot:m.222735 g.222735  ORF g.222735 m.222735 type:complete len:255 (+) comp15938_c0_seq17:15-779(+)
MATQCVVIVLCGLPGAGKSSLAKRLAAADNEGWLIQIFSFDDHLYDPAMQGAGDSPSDAEQDSWKAQRMELLKMLQKSIEEHCSIGRKALPVVIVDDNMYYASMRHSVAQIARDLGCGFGVVMMDCTEETATMRNATREPSQIVDPLVIKRMAQRFEKPDGNKRSWEKHSVILKVEGSIESYTDEVYGLISLCQKNPLQPIVGPDEKAVAEARAVRIHLKMALLKKELWIRLQPQICYINLIWLPGNTSRKQWK